MESDSKRQKESKKWGTAEYLGLGSILTNISRVILDFFKG